MSKRYALYYNKETIGDCLMIVFESNTTPTKVEKNDNVVSLYAHDELIGVNIFNISQIMKIKAHGFIPIIDENVLKIINSILQNANIEPLDPNIGSGFKVALIEEIEEHPDSEHLHICKVNVGSEEKLQIVCGCIGATNENCFRLQQPRECRGLFRCYIYRNREADSPMARES